MTAPATRPTLADYLVLIEDLAQMRDAIDQDLADVRAEASAKWGGLLDFDKRPPKVRGSRWGRG